MHMSGSKWYVKLNKYSSELSVNNILIPRKLINVLTCSQYNLTLYRLHNWSRSLYNLWYNDHSDYMKHAIIVRALFN